jgi:ornithine carbamoyltransferase
MATLVRPSAVFCFQGASWRRLLAAWGLMWSVPGGSEWKGRLMRHLDSLFRLQLNEIEEIFRISADLKSRWNQGSRPRLLDGRVVTLLFEKPSLRTRLSFETAIAHLGGSSLFLSCAEAGLTGREKISDVARVIGGYSDWIVMRVFSHKLVDDFVAYAECPIINGLSDQGHPCQALTDLFTMQEEFDDLKGRTLVFVGDGNNVARSLAVACAQLGVNFVLSAPVGYELPQKFLDTLQRKLGGVKPQLVRDPAEAVKQADVIYTDVWASMGQEAEQEKRKQVFAPYQVNAKLMSLAPAHAKFMHCLPAKRGMEVTDDVIDSPASICFPQAENRMHVSKGILLWMLGTDPVGASDE